MTLKDQMLKVKVGNWDSLWEEAKSVCFEVQEAFALPLTDGGLSDTVSQIISFLGMAAANNSENVHPPNKSSHIVNLAGNYKFYIKEKCIHKLNFLIIFTRYDARKL